jgi:hypothetical protein
MGKVPIANYDIEENLCIVCKDVYTNEKDKICIQCKAKQLLEGKIK